MSSEPAPLAHAEALATATAELIRYQREGAMVPHYPFGIDDIATSTAEALLFILRAEDAALAEAGRDVDDEERSNAGQLAGALAAWLDYNRIAS